MTALPFLFRRKNLHFQHETTAHEEHIRTSKNNDEGVYKWSAMMHRMIYGPFNSQKHGKSGS